MTDPKPSIGRQIDDLAATDPSGVEKLRILWRERERREWQLEQDERRERERSKDDPPDREKLRILWDERVDRVETRTAWWERTKGTIYVLTGVLGIIGGIYGFYASFIVGKGP